MIRSLLQTGFDPFVFDLDASDHIFTIDYVTKHKLRALSWNAEEVWNKDIIEKAITGQETVVGSDGNKHETGIYDRIIERKQRVGYHDMEMQKIIFELINYHGRIDVNNSVVQAYWESEGRTDDPRFVDFTIGICNGSEPIRFHVTPYGSWRHNFKTAHYNEFELEPLGYGVVKVGKKAQREIDITQSRINDSLMLGIYGMHLVGKYAGLNSDQLQIKPWGIVELEDVDQLKQLKVDLNAVVQALAAQGMLKDDFRQTTGAASNLQAVVTKATATEASLTQNEAIRGASVAAEIIAESLVRDHLRTMHINNTDLLDREIAVSMGGRGSGNLKTGSFNKKNLPRNIGFSIKVTTDKDFRPERIQKLLEAINLATSIRNIMPESLNVVFPLVEEYFRSLGIDPRKLSEPVPMADQMMSMLKKRQIMRQFPELANEVAGEQAGTQVGSGNEISTPMGMVPTSPAGAPF